MSRTETPKPIWIKFCIVVDIAEIVPYTNFGDHRLRVFFGGGTGSNFTLSHRLSLSPLLHSRTTVRVCDLQQSYFLVHTEASSLVLHFLTASVDLATCTSVFYEKYVTRISVCYIAVACK